ncbi:hypothetical protein D9M71_291950 [compost metagenome]
MVLDPDVEAAVLRQALLGDVQAGHDLQAHDQRRDDAGFLDQLLVEHAVDALAQAQDLLVRLDVDVRGLHLHSVLEQHLQQAHHRGVAVVEAEAAEVEVALLQALVELAGQLGDLVGAPVEAVEVVEQLALAHHRRLERLAQQAAQLVEGVEIERIAHADQQAVALLDQQDGAEAPRQRLGQALHQCLVELELAQVDVGNVELARQRLEQLLLADEAHVDHRAAELGAAALLLVQRQLQLALADQAGLYQQIAQAQLAPGPFAAIHQDSPPLACTRSRA